MYASSVHILSWFTSTGKKEEAANVIALFRCNFKKNVSQSLLIAYYFVLFLFFFLQTNLLGIKVCDIST